MTTTIDGSGPPSRAMLPFLDREHTIARPGYSRWMVPPAALCVHLCIGQAYAFSVFNLPMTRLLGVTQSNSADWKLTDLIREYNVTHGVPKAQAYNTTMYIMAGLLVIGFLANLCVKAVDKRHHMKPETEADIEPARAQSMAGHAPIMSGRT
jgi:hypothetical protein